MAVLIALLANPSAAVAEMNGIAPVPDGAFHQTTGQIARKALLQMAPSPSPSPTTEAYGQAKILYFFYGVGPF